MSYRIPRPPAYFILRVAMVAVALNSLSWLASTVALADTVRDEFNSISYSGNDGTATWSGDWQEFGESDGPSSGILRVVSNSRCTSGNCIRVGHSDIEDQPTKRLAREVDLSGASTATFTYDFEVQNNDNNGPVLVRVSGNGGSSWTTLATYSPFDGSGSESFDITPYIASNTQVAVEVTGKYSMYLFVDNIQIEYDGVPALSIIKRAFQLDGTPIPSGSTLPKGALLRVLLYINNPGTLRADVSLQDVLDPTFLYVPGSAKYDNSTPNCAATTCTAVEEAAIFAAADSGTVGTDAVDGDVVSFTGVTLDIGNQNTANAQLGIAGSKIWAVVFTTRMQ